MAAQEQTCFKYKRRRPELTPCFRIVNEHLNTFIAAREAENRPLPDYVIQEFEAFLKCGILAYGFLRLKCGTCQGEKIVAFSCKKKGVLPIMTWAGSKWNSLNSCHLLSYGKRQNGGGNLNQVYS